ncbi:MAG: NAD(P)-dependent oxidoreductase [Candidatus Bathyarchaeota archaeon]
MKIAVIGSTGQLGTDLVKLLGTDHQVVPLTHDEIEVSDYSSCLILKEQQPDVVINTAAFHKTDQCEEECLKSFSVNALGARNVAKISKEMKATSVYISINTYGVSKLAGECFTALNPKHYILRIASVFGEAGASGKGGNFVETMIRKAKNNEKIIVVDDMWMSPTYTKDASALLKEILDKQIPYGVYHATNNGYCSWYQFAEEIFRLTGLAPDLKPTKIDPNYGIATRPAFSGLASTKLGKYGLEPRGWEEALNAYLLEKGHI